MKNRNRQLILPFRGGRRPGAGRKAKGPRVRVSHKARPVFAKSAAVHVTLRVAEHVSSLRSGRAFRALKECFAKALGRFGMRLIQFSIQGNHLHLIIEADSSQSLSRGMQGLCIRIAKALNRMMRRHGRVFADHYHSRILKTPAELVNAIAYVLGNHVHHFGGPRTIDPFSSAALKGEHRERLLSNPRTWLLKVGWRRVRTKPHWLDNGRLEQALRPRAGE